MARKLLYAPEGSDSVTIGDGCGESHSVDPTTRLVDACPLCVRMAENHQFVGFHVADSPDQAEEAMAHDEEAQRLREESNQATQAQAEEVRRQRRKKSQDGDE